MTFPPEPQVPMLTREAACVTALLVLSLAGALPAQTVTTPLPTGGEVKRRCEFTITSGKLPPVGSVIDSAAVSAALAPILAKGGPALVVSVVYLPGVSPPEVRWTEQVSGPGEVLSIIRAKALSRPVTEPWAIRLRVSSTADSIGIRTEPSVYCPPQPYGIGGSTRRTAMVRVSPGDRLPTPGSRIRVVIEALVLASGAVGDVRLIRGSGIQQIDNDMMMSAQTQSYLPALLDGIPVDGRYRNDGTRVHR
jgi:hypothetical protein